MEVETLVEDGKDERTQEAADDITKIQQDLRPIMRAGSIVQDFNISDGFEMMQPHWEKFRKDIEERASLLKEKNDKAMEMKKKEIDDLNHQLERSKKEHKKQMACIMEMKNKEIDDLNHQLERSKKEHKKQMACITEMKKKEIDNLNHQLEISKKEHQKQMASIKIEYEENIRDIVEKHTMQLKSLKARVRSTLDEANDQPTEFLLGEIGGDGGKSGIGRGSGIATEFKGDVSAAGDFMVGNKYAVKANAEGNTAGIADMLERFGASAAAQAPGKQSSSDAAEVNVRLDGATMSGNQNVMIDHKSVKINIGSGGKDRDRDSSDESGDDADYENLQERELEKRIQRWRKRTRMNEAIAFKGPNERIIELVFEDKNEDYFDYLIQDVLPKFDEIQLQKIAPYIERYSVINLTQRKYDYRYLQVFFYCSPRTEFEYLLMGGNHLESKDIRNLVKALDSRQRPTHIKLIDLSDCKFDTTAFIELECLLAYTTHVNLSGLTESTVVYPNKTKPFSVEHALQIAKTIQRQEQKSIVNLSRCTLNSSITEAFTPMMSKLKMLTLRYCNIGVEAMAVLVGAIYQTRQLKILDLCETRIGPQSFAHLANSLGILRCLFLSSVMLREEGLGFLVAGLQQVQEGGMECLDLSFNPLNQDIITTVIETALTKVKTVIFSKEQIQSSVHQEKMIRVKTDGTVLMSLNNEMKPIGDSNEASVSSDPATGENGSTADKQHGVSTFPTQGVYGTQKLEEYFFWVLTATEGEIPRGSQKYIASTTQDEIARRTRHNTWYQCFECGTNVAFFGDKIDLNESKHFLRDRKYCGLYENSANSHIVIVTRAEVDNIDDNQVSSSILSKWKESGIGKALFGGKHNCNMTCSVNGMFIRTYKCRSCKEPLGMHYFHKEQIPNRLNNIWCLLQEKPTSLVVGAKMKLVKYQSKEERVRLIVSSSRVGPAGSTPGSSIGGGTVG